ncbi:arylformamidase [Sutcliffiella halmapala]|uniref:arylformamidase n=1 Tax=Sutcliffiella halmapala TaxID=79882 RepID=UPI0009952F45|nr:arylformamidase [Sutcliffiella halmapala]
MKIYDISRPLKAETPTWPGDTAFSYSLNWSKEETGSVNVGSIEMSVHTATHVDAPFHFDNKGAKMAELDLAVFIGPAIVLDVTNVAKINREIIADSLKANAKKRILFKTNAWVKGDEFPTSIPTLHSDVVELLKELEVPLIGVDLPSVDELESKELSIHHLLHKANIAILEGIDLREIEEGEYQLVALPLKLEESDGSPVRAVLMK